MWDKFLLFAGGVISVFAYLLVVPLGRMKQWSEAGDLCRLMNGIFRNYARHALANARELINHDALDENEIKTLLVRQKFEERISFEYRKSIDLLFPADIISLVDHFILLMRNINTTTDYINEQEKKSIEVARNALFARNVRISKISDVIAEFFAEIRAEYFPSPKVELTTPKVELTAPKAELTNCREKETICKFDKIINYYSALRRKLDIFNETPSNNLYALFKILFYIVYILLNTPNFLLKSIDLIRRYCKNWLYVFQYENTEISFHEQKVKKIGDINTVDIKDLERLCAKYNSDILKIVDEKREAVEMILNPRTA